MQYILIAIVFLLSVSSFFLIPKICATKIAKKVNQEIRENYEKEGVVLPEGWNPADQIRGVQTEWRKLPWGSSQIICKLRCLTAGEKPEVSVINRVKAMKEAKSWENQVRYLNTLEEYAKKALVSPTFAEIEREVLGCDGRSTELRNKLTELQAQLKDMQNSREKLEVERELHQLELMTGYCMPINFMQAIASWAECLDVTDITKIEDKDLLTSWLLAQEYHNRASDNVQGVFFSAHRRQYDMRAMEVGQEYRKELQEKQGKEPKMIKRNKK